MNYLSHVIIIVNKMDVFNNLTVNKNHVPVPVYFVTPIICLICKYIIQYEKHKGQYGHLEITNPYFLFFPQVVITFGD